MIVDPLSFLFKSNQCNSIRDDFDMLVVLISLQILQNNSIVKDFS